MNRRAAPLPLVLLLTTACVTSAPQTIAVNVGNAADFLEQDVQLRVYLGGTLRQETILVAGTPNRLIHEVAPGTVACVSTTRLSDKKAAAMQGSVPNRGQGLPVFVSVSETGGVLKLTSDFAVSVPSCQP